MMDNYPYIIASLPEIALDFESRSFDYQSLSSEIKGLCSKSDARLIDWLELGSSESGRNPHFYAKVAKSDNRFLREYFAFDLEMRGKKVKFLSGETFETQDDEEAANLLEAFKTSNLIEREKKLDRLMWNKINDIIGFELFNMNVILAFLAKAAIVERWSRLDQKAGEDFFRNLVSEVRGTFKGVQFDPNEK